MVQAKPAVIIPIPHGDLLPVGFFWEGCVPYSLPSKAVSPIGSNMDSTILTCLDGSTGFIQGKFSI